MTEHLAADVSSLLGLVRAPCSSAYTPLSCLIFCPYCSPSTATSQLWLLLWNPRPQQKKKRSFCIMVHFLQSEHKQKQNILKMPNPGRNVYLLNWHSLWPLPLFKMFPVAGTLGGQIDWKQIQRQAGHFLLWDVCVCMCVCVYLISRMCDNKWKTSQLLKKMGPKYK